MEAPLPLAVIPVEAIPPTMGGAIEFVQIYLVESLDVDDHQLFFERLKKRKTTEAIRVPFLIWIKTELVGGLSYF